MAKIKPTGPIPSGYEGKDGELSIGGEKASHLVSKNGSPLFVYSRERLSQQIAGLRHAMPDDLHIHYAKGLRYPLGHRR